MQVPFNPKDWSVSLPASIFGLGFLIYMFVWAAKQLNQIGAFKSREDRSKEIRGLSAEQREEVRLMIERLEKDVWKRGEKGGLHYANNQINRWLWEEEENLDRRKKPRS